MRVLAGTSGFAYKEWKGSFYPEDLAADAMLRYYAEQLPAVEINNTFYRMPARKQLEDWAAATPPGFTFVLKASRQITHTKRLKDCAEPVAYLFGQAEALGERLGPILFQTPPNLKLDLERFDAFLATLPEGKRAAFEFRNPTWLVDDVYARLRERDLALCIAHDEESETPLVPTASWGYLRLREVRYDDANLAVWRERILAQPWSEAYAFFKHEDEATGPRLARRFLDLLAA